MLATAGAGDDGLHRIRHVRDAGAGDHCDRNVVDGAGACAGQAEGSDGVGDQQARCDGACMYNDK